MIENIRNIKNIHKMSQWYRIFTLGSQGQPTPYNHSKISPHRAKYPELVWSMPNWARPGTQIEFQIVIVVLD